MFAEMQKVGLATVRGSSLERVCLSSAAGSADCGDAEELQATNNGALCPSHTRHCITPDGIHVYTVNKSCRDRQREAQCRDAAKLHRIASFSYAR